MGFKEFFYQNEWTGWKYWGQKSARVDTPLGLIVPNARGVFGALPAQVTGSEPNELPIRSGGYDSSNWANPNFDLKLPEESLTGQIVSCTQGGNEWNPDANKGENHLRPVIVTLQINNKTRNFSIPFSAIRKMTNKPQVGKTATIVLQRRPESANEAPSQIQKIQVF